MGALRNLAAIYGIAKGAPNPFEWVADAFGCRPSGRAEKDKKKHIAKKNRKAAKTARRRNRK